MEFTYFDRSIEGMTECILFLVSSGTGISDELIFACYYVPVLHYAKF